MEARIGESEDVARYLERHEQKDILRFVTVGSVDDGKSTLIGRLLHDTHGIYEDQLSAVKSASNMAGAEIDFSLFTDGLIAEREQGITIDVAYRYFATEKRKFIIADTPGHVQYTRNMATGASTASVAIILIDARLGVLAQSRRHAYIASLLGIAQLCVCVNKMDLRGYDLAVFEAIRREFSEFAAGLDFQGVTYIPISALTGDNVVTRASTMPTYDGPTLLEHLESVPVGEEDAQKAFRYPVQIVLRPSHDYRAYAGQIASGCVKTGDSVMVLPSRKVTKVLAIDHGDQSLDVAVAPMSVAIRLADEIDVSRGDMLVHPTQAPRAVTRFEATLVWMSERPLDRAKSYLLKHTTQTVRAEVEVVSFTVDLETLAPVPATGLSLNDIGGVTLRSHRPLFVDAYRDNRATGAFVLIDSLTNDTVAAGMIKDDTARSIDTGVFRGCTQVSMDERRERLGQSAAVVVLEGAPTDALRAVAFATERLLFDRGAVACVIEEQAGESADIGASALGACVDAGLIVIFIAKGAHDSRLTGQLERAPVLRPRVDEGDAEHVGATIVRALAAGGLLGEVAR